MNIKEIYVPKEILREKSLSLNEKIILIDIISTINKNGYYSYRDSEIAKLYHDNIKRYSVAKALTSLSQKGYINVMTIKYGDSNTLEDRIISLRKELVTGEVFTQAWKDGTKN